MIHQPNATVADNRALIARQLFCVHAKKHAYVARTCIFQSNFKMKSSRGPIFNIF